MVLTTNQSNIRVLLGGATKETRAELRRAYTRTPSLCYRDIQGRLPVASVAVLVWHLEEWPMRPAPMEWCANSIAAEISGKLVEG